MNFLKKYKKLILKLIVSIGLFSLIIKNTNIQDVVRNLQMLNPIFIPLIISFLILNYIVSSVRWKNLLVFENTKNVKLPYLISLYFIGSFFNNFMPTSIGGDVYKIARLGKKVGSNSNAFAATFMERFTGVLVLILISVVSLIQLGGYRTIVLLFLFFISLVAGLYALRFLSKRVKVINKIYASLLVYKNEKKVLAVALLTSLIVQLLAIFTQYFIFMSVGAAPPLFYALFTLPIITLAGFFVPSLNGIGVQDALYMQFFSTAGISPEVSLGASVIYHLFRLFVSLIGGVFYAFEKSD